MDRAHLTSAPLLAPSSVRRPVPIRIKSVRLSSSQITSSFPFRHHIQFISMATGSQGPDMKSLHIVSLGSSFAAGPGIEPQTLKAAGRSERNYAHLLAKRLGARITDLSVSGATLKNILSEPQVLFGNHFEPQLSAFPSDADIVTITGGGNDLQYIGGLMRATLQSSLMGRLISRFLPLTRDEELLTAEDVAERFVAIIDKIRETSPRCRILLVEYLTIFGRNTRPGIDIPLNEAQIKNCQSIANMLQKAYRLTAEARRGCKVIPVAELSHGHGLGSEEPWVDGFSFGMMLARRAPFHPNAKGMEAVAEMLYEELKGDEGALKVQTAKVAGE